MMLSLGLAFLAAAVAGPDDDVKRETGTGSRLAKRADIREWDEDKTRKIQADFGSCVIKRQPAASRHFVLTPNMEKPEWRKEVAKIADGYCLSIVTTTMADVEMKFPVDSMRYALADALVRNEFAAGPAPSIKDAAPLEQPKLREEDYQPEPGKKLRKGELEKLQEARQKQMALIYLSGFGECVVKADPANSYALLMADPGAPQEGAAFKAMMPAFGSCLTAGQSLSFNKTILRGTIAMNYYRLAHAPKVVATTAGGQK